MMQDMLSNNNDDEGKEGAFVCDISSKHQTNFYSCSHESDKWIKSRKVIAEQVKRKNMKKGKVVKT